MSIEIGITVVKKTHVFLKFVEKYARLKSEKKKVHIIIIIIIIEYS